MNGINAPTVTVLGVGARLIRQRGTDTGTTKFIAAYLAAEYARDPLCGFTAGWSLSEAADAGRAHLPSSTGSRWRDGRGD